MKLIYNKIIALLSEIESIHFLDLDKGQLETNNTAVAFPAVLVNINLPECRDITDLEQRVRAQIVLRVAFDYTGETSAAAPEGVREQSLSYFDLLDEVYAKLQGYADADIDTISRRGVQQELREDGLKVTQIMFECWFDDETAA